MNKTEKAELVSEIKEQIENSTSIYLVDYRGISVDEINKVRRDFLKEGIKYKVYKNTLFKKALEELDRFPELENLLEGMIGYAFTSEENYAAPAKIIKKFNDDHKKFEIIKGVIGYFKKEKQYDVVDVDGVRVTFPDGWGLVRASNTQPILVMRFEATTEKRRDEIQALIEGKVSEFSK